MICRLDASPENSVAHSQQLKGPMSTDSGQTGPNGRWAHAMKTPDVTWDSGKVPRA